MPQPLATIGERFTAQFIDGLVALAAGVVFYIVAAKLDWPLELAIVGWVLYLLLCDGLPGGQSLGKKFTKSSVVHIDSGLPCGYFRSIVRNVSLMFLSFFDWIFIVGRQRRRLGDYLARTKVIRVKAREV
jgi:uncharacterized RDD family membrane protein YckC